MVSSVCKSFDLKGIFGGILKKLSAQILPTTTAGTHPQQFSDDLFFAQNAKIAAAVVAIFLIIGFALRVGGLGIESLSEDELNKLETVQEYRTNGLSGKNGEHPFLMKGMQTVSVSAADRINESIASSDQKISQEAALRFPVALFGTFTTLLIFLLASEIFGRSIGLVSAMLWAVEPMAIGFDRIAKEDSLVLFFFLLTMLFWIRGQTAAERGDPRWAWYAWAAAASFAALMASKYYPHLLAIPAAYYIIFQYIPATRWRMETARWVKFIVIMGVTFLILNPTILLPDTWREMLKFSSESRIGHDSYEFMGAQYPHRLTAWLNGVPWTFYFVFIAVKTSLPILILFLIGLPMMFKRRLGDGRFFIFFWAFMWFLPFTVMGGKFTRYFTFVEPLLLIIAAVGFCFSAKWIVSKLFVDRTAASFAHVFLLMTFVAFPLYNAITAAPHFRIFTNSLGSGMAPPGSYFPHDEFYDAATREIVTKLSAIARPDAVVACETPALFKHYAQETGRKDLTFVSLSDPLKVSALRIDDFIVLVEGRRYFSNLAYTQYLKTSASAAAEARIRDINAASLYRLNEETLTEIKLLAR